MHGAKARVTAPKRTPRTLTSMSTSTSTSTARTGHAASVTVALEPPRQPEVERLLDGSTAYAQSLYPPESNFLLDVATLEAPGVAFFVARQGGTAVGIAALVVEAGEPDATGPARGELKRMFVDPSARGAGVARALLDAIETAARARGLDELVLETGPLHHAALALYRRHGFRDIPQFGQYVGEEFSVCMAKELPPLA